MRSTRWRKVLHDGMVEGTAFQPKTVSAKVGDLGVTAANDPDGTVEVIFRADPNIYDGRYANVGWLQEIPKPVTSMSWDNAALMSYRTLAKFGLAEQDVVAIESNGNTVMAPVLAVPGHADGAVTVYLGYARRNGGRVAGGLGFNAYAIRTSNALLFASGATMKKTGQTLRVRGHQEPLHRSPLGRRRRRWFRRPFARRQRGPDARHHSLRHAR